MNFREQHDSDGERIPEDGARTRIAMQLGAAMNEAQEELGRESMGVEAARRAGEACRAAYLAMLDAGNADSPGVYLAVLQIVCQQAYGAEWTRLMNTPREEWHR